MKITENLDVGLTQKTPNMAYLGFTFINIIRGWYVGVELIWFGVYLQVTYRIKPKLTRVES
jgi:hypothetical protein